MSQHRDATVETSKPTNLTLKHRREPLSPPLIVVVQSIYVGWSKEARGGKGAVLRNAIPEVVRMPLHLWPSFADNPLLHHQRGYDGARGLSSAHDKIMSLADADALTIGCVTVERTAEGVCATYQYEEKCGGAPHRDHFRRHLRMTQGQWGQILYNGRFTHDDGDWHYKKIVVNVGLFDAAAIVPSLFTRSAPNERLSVMAFLF